MLAADKTRNTKMIGAELCFICSTRVYLPFKLIPLSLAHASPVTPLYLMWVQRLTSLSAVISLHVSGVQLFVALTGCRPTLSSCIEGFWSEFVD